MAQYTRRPSGLLVRTQAVDTYLRNNALAYGVQPTLALPVFDRGQTHWFDLAHDGEYRDLGNGDTADKLYQRR